MTERERMTFHPVPLISTCIPGLSTPATLKQQITTCMQRYADERLEHIKKFHESNSHLNHMEAAMQYDMFHAPFTSNHDMLVLGCGVTIVPPLSIEQTLAENIEHLANALAALNIFCINHTHLDDRTVYACMWKAINEELPFLPPSDHVSEYIDFSSTPESELPNADRVLPMSNQEISWNDTLTHSFKREPNHD